MTAKGRLRAKARKKARKAAKKRGGAFGRKKVCRFCADQGAKIEYRDAKTLRYFMTETGKLIPSRISGQLRAAPAPGGGRHQAGAAHRADALRAVPRLARRATMANVKLILKESVAGPRSRRRRRRGEARLRQELPGARGQGGAGERGQDPRGRAPEAPDRREARQGAGRRPRRPSRRSRRLQLEVKAKAGEEGKLFGSVTAAQVAELLAARGMEIDRRKIDLGEPIKEVGDHTVSVRLHAEVAATRALEGVARGVILPVETGRGVSVGASGFEADGRGRRARRGGRGPGPAPRPRRRALGPLGAAARRARLHRRRRRGARRRLLPPGAPDAVQGDGVAPRRAAARRPRDPLRLPLDPQAARLRRRAGVPGRDRRLRGHRRPRRPPRAHRARQGGEAAPDAGGDGHRRVGLRGRGQRRRAARRRRVAHLRDQPLPEPQLASAASTTRWSRPSTTSRRS